LARIVVDPTPVPVTGIAVLVLPARIVTLAGTVASAVLSLESVKVRPPAGAAPEMVRVALVVTVLYVLSGDGVMVAIVLTVTGPEAGAKPVPVAAMVVLPMETPVTCGLVVGTVDPAAMKIDEVTVATDGLALVRVMVRPPVGAGVPRLIGRLWVPPRATVGMVPKLISEEVPVTLVEPVVYPVALAVRLLVPAATPV